MTVRVVVVDDHTLVRQGIVGLLASQSDIDVVGQAGDAREAMEVIASVARCRADGYRDARPERTRRDP